MRVLVGLGSNVRPVENVQAALEAMRREGGLEAASRLWQTPPVGMQGPPFVNAAAILRCASEREARAWLGRQEGLLGRRRTATKYADRTIDLDLLAVQEGRWRVVHPRLGEEPYQFPGAAELLPDLRVPPTGESVAALWRRHPLAGARPLEAAPARPPP